MKGDLGAGKTSFARAFIRARGDAHEEVPSPTFTLVQIYRDRAVAIWHFDLYRLDGAEEAWELGIEEAFASGISLIEWPERLGLLAAAAPPRNHSSISAIDRRRGARFSSATPDGGRGWPGLLPMSDPAIRAVFAELRGGILPANRRHAAAGDVGFSRCERLGRCGADRRSPAMRPFAAITGSAVAMTARS